MTRVERDFLRALRGLERTGGAVMMTEVRNAMTQRLSLPDFKRTMDGLEEQGLFKRVSMTGGPHLLYPDDAAIALRLDPPVPLIAAPGSRSRRSPLAERAT